MIAGLKKKGFYVMGFLVRFVMLLCMAMIFVGQSVPVQAAGKAKAQAEDSQFIFNFYGQSFTVAPKQVQGTSVTFDQAKAYIHIVFPDYKKDVQEPIEIIAFVQALIKGYSELYDSAIDILANRLIQEGKVKNQDIDKLKEDLMVFFRHGKMKQGIERYAPKDKAFAYHFAQVQEMYLRHLTCVYVYNMIRNSPEGIKALEEFSKAQEEEKE